MKTLNPKPNVFVISQASASRVIVVPKADDSAELCDGCGCKGNCSAGGLDDSHECHFATWVHRSSRLAGFGALGTEFSGDVKGFEGSGLLLV